MSKFYSESNRPKTIPMPKTSTLEKEYKEKIGKNGKKELVEVGVTNVYEKIQEARQGSELATLINQYKMKINENNILELEKTVTDLTNIPTNLIEAQNMINDAKNTFNLMPTEIKQTYNNNFNEFLAGSMNGSLETLIKEYKPTKVEEKIEKAKPTIQTEIEATKAKLEALQKQEINNG